MIVLRNNSFSMSDQEFEEKEKAIKHGYKNSAIHAGAATGYGAITTQMAKHLLKKGAGNKGLAAAGALSGAGATGYHSYKAVENARGSWKQGRDPEYRKKLDKVFEKQDKEDDAKLRKLEKKEAEVKKLKKDLGMW